MYRILYLWMMLLQIYFFDNRQLVSFSMVYHIQTVFISLDRSKKIPTPPTEEISAKFVSDYSKCIKTSKVGRTVNFQFPSWGRYACFLDGRKQIICGKWVALIPVLGILNETLVHVLPQDVYAQMCLGFLIPTAAIIRHYTNMQTADQPHASAQVTLPNFLCWPTETNFYFLLCKVSTLSIFPMAITLQKVPVIKIHCYYSLLL